MSYEYDSKINRELAKTAMSIYMDSHNIQNQPEEITESTEMVNEEILQNHVNGLILEYVSDVVILAEKNIGRELKENEIELFAQYMIESIDGLGEEGRIRLISELAGNQA